MFEKFLISIAVVLVGFVLFLMIMYGVQEYNRPICLKNGYANVSVTYQFNAYCITEINETEVVTPIEELR